MSVTRFFPAAFGRIAIILAHADYDSPWKEILERYFEEFIAFFFPKAYEGIDWDKGFDFLDKELQQVVRDAELGRRFVDKLVRVGKKNGEERWVLIHIEVQGQIEFDFAKRMYTYNYRLFDRYDRQVATFAVLTDERKNWRPNLFHYELWGCEVRLKFPVIKLLDYQTRIRELEESKNPFALVVLSHLSTLATKESPDERFQVKFSLVKKLYKRGYSKEDILELFRFIDWVLVLPQELEQRFVEAVEKYEEEKKVRYVTSVERVGIQKGIQQGVQQGIQQGIQQGLLKKSREAIIEILEARFEKMSSTIVITINSIEELAVLDDLLKKAATVTSLDEFEAIVSSKK